MLTWGESRAHGPGDALFVWEQERTPETLLYLYSTCRQMFMGSDIDKQDYHS